MRHTPRLRSDEKKYCNRRSFSDSIASGLPRSNRPVIKHRPQWSIRHGPVLAAANRGAHGKNEGKAMRVRLATDGDLAAWQKFVDGNDAAGCMHHAGWYGVLREACWVTPYFLMAVNDQGTIEGILPTYFSRSPLTGRHISSLEDGVLAPSAEAATALLTEARSLRDRTRSRYLQIRGGMVDREAEITQPTVRTIIETAKPVEKLWTAVKKKTRRAVRQAEQQDLCIEHDAELARLSDFYAAYAAHMRDLGTPVFGFDMFAAIVKHLGRDRLRLYIVRHEGASDRGHVVHRQWPPLDGLLRDRPSVAGDRICQLPALLACHSRCLANGVVRLDLGRSTPDSNVHLFKRKWRGSDIEVPYHFYLGPAISGRKTWVLTGKSKTKACCRNAGRGFPCS